MASNANANLFNPNPLNPRRPCNRELSDLLTYGIRIFQPSWYKLNRLIYTVRDIAYSIPDGRLPRHGLLRGNLRNENYIRGSIIGSEASDEVNRILINDIKQHFTERGFTFTPWNILSNKAFSSLVATYIFINGQESLRELANALGSTYHVPTDINEDAEQFYLGEYHRDVFYGDESRYGVDKFICTMDALLLLEPNNRPKRATWYQVYNLHHIVRRVSYGLSYGLTPDDGMLEGKRIIPPTLGSILGPEATDAINRILTRYIKENFTERGFTFTPYNIMSNDAFSGLIATYIFINGPESWRELGREFGVQDLPAIGNTGELPNSAILGPNDEVINGVVVGPDPKPRGGGRRKNRTKKSSRRSRHRSRRRRNR